MEDDTIKELKRDFQNLMENAWYFVRTKDSTPLPGEQEKNEKYLTDLFKKWEGKLY